jgi:hypothetical protein
MAKRHPLLQIHACYTDRRVDIVSEGYECAIRVGYLEDSNLIAKRIGPIYDKLVASPEYVKAHGAPTKPSDILKTRSAHAGHRELALHGRREDVHRHCVYACSPEVRRAPLVPMTSIEAVETV